MNSGGDSLSHSSDCILKHHIGTLLSSAVKREKAAIRGEMHLADDLCAKKILSNLQRRPRFTFRLRLRLLEYSSGHGDRIVRGPCCTD
jgi:hypothetical protein